MYDKGPRLRIAPWRPGSYHTHSLSVATMPSMVPLGTDRLGGVPAIWVRCRQQVPTSRRQVTRLLKATTGNFSDTSSSKSRNAKGSIGHAFTVCIRTENQNQMSFYPFVPHEISVLVELILGHLRYDLTDVPPQPNSPPDNVFHPDRRAASGHLKARRRGKPRLRLME